MLSIHVQTHFDVQNLLIALDLYFPVLNLAQFFSQGVKYLPATVIHHNSVTLRYIIQFVPAERTLGFSVFQFEFVNASTVWSIYAPCCGLTSKIFTPLLPPDIVQQRDSITIPNLTPASLCSQVQGFNQTLLVCVQ